MRCVALLVVPALLGLCYAGVNDDNGGAAAQASPNNQGGSSQDTAGPARVEPQIVPGGLGDSGEEGNVVSMTGYIPAQSGGNGGQTGSFGAIPPQSGVGANQGAAAAGDSSNSVDGGGQFVGGNVGRSHAAPVAGADAGRVMHHQDLQSSSSGMSGAAIAGVVAGVVVIGAVGTAIAVVALKSSSA